MTQVQRGRHVKSFDRMSPTIRRMKSFDKCDQLVTFISIVIVTATLAEAAASVTTSGQSAHLNALTACDYSVPLGMIDEEIKDWQISSSSVRSSSETSRTSSCHERHGRLYQPNGLSWCAKYKTSSEWLQVDLGVISKVTGVLLQGRGDGMEWVTSFLVSYSLDAFNWKYAGDTFGNKRIFDGNTDSYGIQAAYMSEPLKARFIKVHTLTWHGHPSMRVEIIGCQPCKVLITLPTTTKISASSEQATPGGSSCRADDGLLMTGKAWCAKTNDDAQWLQFDVGPPTVVTGVVTAGREDSNRQQWVTRYRLAYSNDTILWKYYSDAIHLEPKEFGGNVNADIERWHFVNSPFVARYIRLYPIDWSTHISLRAGLIGCRHKGKCEGEFIRTNPHSPCVENLSYKKPIWVNSYRPKHKKRRHTSHVPWRRAHSGSNNFVSRDVTIRVDDVTGNDAESCITLNSLYVDKPTLRIDLGQRSFVSGVIVTAVTSSMSRVLSTNSDVNATVSRASAADIMEHDIDRLDVFVADDILSAENLPRSRLCGTSARSSTKTAQGQAVSSRIRSQANIRCTENGQLRRHEGRYVYIQATAPTSFIRPTSGSRQGKRAQFSVVICDLAVY